MALVRFWLKFIALKHFRRKHLMVPVAGDTPNGKTDNYITHCARDS